MALQSSQKQKYSEKTQKRYKVIHIFAKSYDKQNTVKTIYLKIISLC